MSFVSKFFEYSSVSSNKIIESFEDIVDKLVSDTDTKNEIKNEIIGLREIQSQNERNIKIQM